MNTQTIQAVQEYKQPDWLQGIGLAVMALTSAAVITLLLTWAPSSSAGNDAAADAGAQPAVAIEAPANPRHGLNDLPRRPTCAALGKSARTPDIAETAQASDAVGCGIPDTLAEGTPTAIRTASE